MTSAPIELFDTNPPFLASHAKQMYTAASKPISTRSRRVFNDIISCIHDRAAEGRMLCSVVRCHANLIIYTAKPINLRERFASYYGMNDYAPYGVSIELNDADLNSVIGSLTECGYDVTEFKRTFHQDSFTISWDT